MRFKLSVFGAFFAVLLGLEYIFDVPSVATDSDPLGVRLLTAALIAVGATFFWVQLRSPRSLPAAPLEDEEIMRIRASMLPQLYAGYTRLRAELLEKLVDVELVEGEEFFSEGLLVSRRQYLANPNSENEAKCDSRFSALRKLHAAWEENTPGLKELNEKIGNCRECLFILQYGTAGEIRNLLADAKARGWGSK